MSKVDGQILSNDKKTRVLGGKMSDNAVGLIVDIRTKQNVTREDGACRLSHIVWEQH